MWKTHLFLYSAYNYDFQKTWTIMHFFPPFAQAVFFPHNNNIIFSILH